MRMMPKNHNKKTIKKTNTESSDEKNTIFEFCVDLLSPITPMALCFVLGLIMFMCTIGAAGTGMLETLNNNAATFPDKTFEELCKYSFPDLPGSIFECMSNLVLVIYLCISALIMRIMWIGINKIANTLLPEAINMSYIPKGSGEIVSIIMWALIIIWAVLPVLIECFPRILGY